MARNSGNDGIVFSTEFGRMCPGCAKPLDHCTCAGDQPNAGDGIVRVSRQTAGRKGNGVTVVTGLPLSGPELKALAKQLKQRCGSGGAIKNGQIEIQGEHRDVLVSELEKRGYRAKRAGG